MSYNDYGMKKGYADCKSHSKTKNFNLEDNKQSLPRQNCVQNVLYPLNV